MAPRSDHPREENRVQKYATKLVDAYEIAGGISSNKRAPTSAPTMARSHQSSEEARCQHLAMKPIMCPGARFGCPPANASIDGTPNSRSIDFNQSEAARGSADEPDREARQDAKSNRIGRRAEHDRDRAGCGLCVDRRTQNIIDRSSPACETLVSASIFKEYSFSIVPQVRI